MTQDINTLRRKFGITAPVAVLIVALACGGDSPSAPTPPNPRPNPGPNPGSNVLHAPDPPPSSPMDPIVHRYALDLSIGSGAGCESVAEDARHRTYVADIHSTGGANYVVRLYEAAFLSGLTVSIDGCRTPERPLVTSSWPHSLRIRCSLTSWALRSTTSTGI
jgi:hypothetical protein